MNTCYFYNQILLLQDRRKNGLQEGNQLGTCTFSLRGGEDPSREVLAGVDGGGWGNDCLEGGSAGPGAGVG